MRTNPENLVRYSTPQFHEVDMAVDFLTCMYLSDNSMVDVDPEDEGEDEDKTVNPSALDEFLSHRLSVEEERDDDVKSIKQASIAIKCYEFHRILRELCLLAEASVPGCMNLGPIHVDLPDAIESIDPTMMDDTGYALVIVPQSASVNGDITDTILATGLFHGHLISVVFAGDGSKLKPAETQDEPKPTHRGNGTVH